MFACDGLSCQLAEIVRSWSWLSILQAMSCSTWSLPLRVILQEMREVLTWQNTFLLLNKINRLKAKCRYDSGIRRLGFFLFLKAIEGWVFSCVCSTAVIIKTEKWFPNNKQASLLATTFTVTTVRRSFIVLWPAYQNICSHAVKQNATLINLTPEFFILGCELCIHVPWQSTLFRTRNSLSKTNYQADKQLKF